MWVMRVRFAAFFVLSSIVCAAGCSSSSGSDNSCAKALYTCSCGGLTSGTSSSECRADDLPGPSTCCTWGSGSDAPCICAAYVCYSIANSCICGWGPANETNSDLPASADSIVSSCTGTYCCNESPELSASVPIKDVEGECICGDFPCSTGQVQVDHCGRDNPPDACPGAATEVSSCP
jgi:hypothetical protein